MVGRGSRASHAGQRRGHARRPATKQGVETDRLLARIETLSRGARANWFGLTAYLAFAGVTLLGVEDADFFVPGRQTMLPLLGVSIPTVAFFYAAPVPGLFFHVFLHYRLRALWQALSDAPREINGRPLAEQIFPWVVNDLAMDMRPDQPRWEDPRRHLSIRTALALTWGAAPVVLAALWWRSMPAHEPWMTQLSGAWLSFGLLMSLLSWWTLRKAMRDGVRDLKTAKHPLWILTVLIEQPEGWKFGLRSVSHPGFPC